MITTYDQVRSGIENRVNLKTLDSIFLKNIEHGAKCPPFVSQAILDSAKRIFNLGNRDREEQSIKPGQIKIVGILSSEPAGKPLKDCRTGICVVTLNAGKEDQEILFRDGVSALRQARILRITEEACDQGICLTQEDLAFNIFGCGLRTIRRDIRSFKDKGIYVPTRGQQKDIGPGISHKVLAVRMFLDRKSDLEIARTIHHSLKAIERYTITFAKVVVLLEKGLNPAELAFIVQISERLVRQYRDLYTEYNRPPYRDRMDEILNKTQMELLSPFGKKKLPAKIQVPVKEVIGS